MEGIIRIMLITVGLLLVNERSALAQLPGKLHTLYLSPFPNAFAAFSSVINFCVKGKREGINTLLKVHPSTT